MFPYRDQAPLQNLCFFFFNDTATTEIYTLSLHDALPISPHHLDGLRLRVLSAAGLFPRTLRCRLRRQLFQSLQQIAFGAQVSPYLPARVGGSGNAFLPPAAEGFDCCAGGDPDSAAIPPAGRGGDYFALPPAGPAAAVSDVVLSVPGCAGGRGFPLHPDLAPQFSEGIPLRCCPFNRRHRDIFGSLFAAQRVAAFPHGEHGAGRHSIWEG